MWVKFYLVNYGLFLEQRIPNVMNFGFHIRTTRSPSAIAVRIISVKSYVTQTVDVFLPACLPAYSQSRCVCLLYPIQFSYMQHFEYLYSATQLSAAQCSCSN
jgi:hypothetical protein